MRTPILPRLLLALALTSVTLAIAGLVVPATNPVWLRARTLVPAVLLATLLMEWVADREEGLVYRFTKHLRQLWDNGAGGFYGAIAAGTFVELEVRAVIAETSSADSVGEWLRDQALGAIVGFSLSSVLNLVEAAIWFVGWLRALSLAEGAVLGGACFAAYVLGRWAWPDRDGHDPVVPFSGARAPSE